MPPPIKRTGLGPSDASEFTPLNKEENSTFTKWIAKNQIKDLDHPDSYYDYRGFWKNNPNFAHKPGEHFVDTYKQHGHPTFSGESKYSKPGEGGMWVGDNLVQQPKMAISHAHNKR